MMYLVGFLLVSIFAFSKAQVISQWTPFSECSATCSFNNPVRTRTRTCTPDNLCQNVPLFDFTPCNTEFACPDYRLGDWGTWSACSSSCRSTQSNPVRVRVRDYCLSNSSSLYQCTADFMVNYEPCNTTACPIVKSCSNLNITFVIVLDSSSSVNDLSWSQEKGFATSFIANSELGVNPNVQVAVVNFASYAVVSSPCGALTNKNDFVNFMAALPRINGGTAINDGLLKARDAYKSCQRLNVDPVVLFLTDGYENIESDNAFRVQTENTVKSEALLFVGAIGPDVNPTDINRMSHYVDVNGLDVYYNRFASNFSELASIKAEEFYPVVLGKLQCDSQGQWSSWSAWGSCSVVCGASGYQRRERSCINPTTLKVQEDCEVIGNLAKYDYMICSAQCRVFSEWSTWSQCSASCRIEPAPTTTRSRACGSGLGNCVGLYSETVECNTNVPCQGTLSSWGFWGVCSASCQITTAIPTQTRTRTCLGATLGGNCNNAVLSDFQNCNSYVNCQGSLTLWSSWGACSDVCNTPGDGPYQTRERSCTGFSTWNATYFGCDNSVRIDQQLCNQNIPCLGTYSAWSAWSICSESCQSNVNSAPYQFHTRTCTGDTLGGGCTGISYESQVCNVGVSCPGIISDWASWGSCSASCQLDFVSPTRTRTRTCTGGTFGGNCNGQVLTSSENCNVEVLCPGTLTDWSNWGACSDICNTVGDGPYQSRERSCVGFSTWNPNYKGCVGASRTDQQLCNQNVGCLGTYSQWSAWSTCSESCQSNPSVSPFQSHSRTCQGDTLNAGCVGASFESQVCNVGVSCPGILSPWSGFSSCSQSCQIGTTVPTMRRNRSCLTASLGGNCNGAALEDIQSCNVGTACPGQLTDWSAWSACPASCQAVVNVYLKQYRSRQCVNASFTGNCNGQSLTDEAICAKDVPCPGIIQPWSSWSECSDSCRRSLSVVPSQTRTRVCLDATLGANCGGLALTESISCNANVGCPGVWTSWGPFTDCSASCQTDGNIIPTQSRQRFCVNNTLDGVCPSDNNVDKVQTVPCSVGVICPVRGTWGAWSGWSTCSASCDAGVIRRSRVCSAPYPPGAGDDCIGNSTQELPCKLFDCPKSCPISKRCNCSQVKQWSSVPNFNQFQGRDLSLESIDSVLGFLGFYGEDTVSRACEACDNMLLSTLRAQIADHLNQAKAARVKLELIKTDLRDVINCNSVIQNNLGLWQLYDLVFERAAMLDGVIIELNSIYLRFDAALTSCQSYGWIHQTFKTILRKCT